MVACASTARAVRLLVAAVVLAAFPALAVLTAAGPTGDDFMWQGMQQEFVRADGTHCRGRTAMAVSQNAVCYVAPDDTLRCAGSIYSKRFGSTFTDAGITGVEQILLSPTRTASFPSPWIFFGPRNAICVKKHDGSAWCRGAYNPDGQFGNGTTSSNSSFTRWGCSDDLVAIGTGNWEQICALDHAGRVTCAGKSHGSAPTFEPGTHHRSFWVDPTGAVHADDPKTFRASNGRTDCHIHPRSPGQLICHKRSNGALECHQFPARPDDLACLGGTPWFLGPNQNDLWGPPSTSPLIVDGGTFLKTYPGVGICGVGYWFYPDTDEHSLPLSCWLTVEGQVLCMCTRPLNSPSGIMELFERGRLDNPTADWTRIVAMATDPWSESVCAVPEDGSLWCIGENHSGKFGTGSDDDLATETQVQPPGSVRTGCETPASPPPPLPPPPSTGTCPCPGLTRLSFTTREGTGACGLGGLTTGSFPLACGGLYFGGGGQSNPLPIPQPDMTQSVFSASGCSASGSLTLGPRTAAEEGRLHCTDKGCLFGAPVPVVNEQTPPVSSCLVNVLSAPATGTASCATGTMNVDLSIDSVMYLAGDTGTDPKGVIPGVQPCPICAPSIGAETCPGPDACGTCCHGGPNHLKPCTPGSGAIGAAFPTSQDCPPAPAFDIGTIPASFRLTTGTVSWTATVATNDTGSTVSVQKRIFVGYCRDADATGEFQAPARRCWQNGMAVGAPCSGKWESCEQRNQGAFGPNGGAVRGIKEFGAPAGAIVDGQPHAATLGTIFAIPPTFDVTVDAADDLPGPGAASLQVDLQLLP
jgi:hypothetical protein